MAGAYRPAYDSRSWSPALILNETISPSPGPTTGFGDVVPDFATIDTAETRFQGFVPLTGFRQPAP